MLARRLILDIDSSESPVHGAQEQSAYNGHFESVCYHPLLIPRGSIPSRLPDGSDNPVYRAARYAANREQEKARAADYRAAHREPINARRRASPRKKAYDTAYRAAHREQIRARNATPERKAARSVYNLNWYMDHPGYRLLRGGPPP